MTQYQAFDPEVEVHGRTILTIVDDALSQFSEAYRQRALEALAANGIHDPSPDEWYPQQAWLDSFEAIATELEPHILDRLGEQVPADVPWPDDIDGVAAGLRSIDRAYQRNHRGGEIGFYRFQSIDEQSGTVTCRNPYPCPFDRGLIREVARNQAPVEAFVFVEERGDHCRRDGDHRCTYTVTW